MKKKKILKYSILVILFLVLGITILVGSQQNNYLKYYETFNYSDTSKNEITFINELSQNQTKGKWHIQVYFNQNGEVIKFENKNREGKIYETISDTINLKVKYNNRKS